jgi:hypothetical protein
LHRRIVLPRFCKNELHFDTLLELPNGIGISLIGYLPSKFAHFLLNSIAIDQRRFTCSDLSDSFPDDSHGVGVRFIEPLTKCGAFLWCQLFHRFLDFSQIRHIRTPPPSFRYFLTAVSMSQGLSNLYISISVTPSAVSHALNRLRQTIGDELFIPGELGMQPTRRALELATAVREGLENFELALTAKPFVPGGGCPDFRIAATRTAAHQRPSARRRD